MKVRNWFIAVFFGAALTLFVYSCESTDDGSPTGPISSAKLSKSDAQNPTSQRRAARAQAELERVLSDIYDADEIDLDRIDFSEADRLYREAIEADPNNTEAQFGAAITSLLVLAINEDARATQDSLNAYMGNEGGEIFLGYLDLVATTEVAGKLPLMTAKMTQDAIADPLKVSDLQQTISEEIIPAIDYSLERLQIVEDDLSFTFELTPKMQGDEYEEVREIDLGEAYMIDAQLRLLKAIFQVAIAYNFDFDDNGSYASFDDDSDENILRHWERLLDPTGTFMTLRSPDAMRDAKASILAAIDKIEEGLGAIRTETDDQYDDIIRVEDLDDLDDEIDLSDQGDDVPAFFREIRTVNTALRKAREILEGTVEIEADFDGDSYTPKQTVIFDVGQFFDNPVADLRTLLPYHTWHLDLLQNRNFVDELVLTDAEGNALEDSPPLVFPDPSFGGVFSNISNNEQLLDLFGINDENHNRKDLLYELGLIRWRDGGIVVTNKATAAVNVRYSGELVGNTWLAHSATVGRGTEGLDVVRSEFGRPFAGGSRIRLSIEEDGRYIFDYEFWSDGNIYITVYDDYLTIDVPEKYYTLWDVYKSYILELP